MPGIVERMRIHQLPPVLRHGGRRRTSDKSVESLFGCGKRAVQITVELKLGTDRENIALPQTSTVNVAAASKFQGDRHYHNTEQQNNAQDSDRAFHVLFT